MGHPHRKDTILTLVVQEFYHFFSGHLCSGAKTTAGKKQLHFAHLKRSGETDFGTIVCLSSGHDLQISDLFSISLANSSEGFKMSR